MKFDPLAVSTTSPQHSRPGTKVPSGAALYSPSTVNTSAKFKPIARTAILHSFGPSASRAARSLSFKFCKLPFLEISHARRVAPDASDADARAALDARIACFLRFVFVVAADAGAGGRLLAWAFIAPASGVGGTTRFEGRRRAQTTTGDARAQVAFVFVRARARS
jgi:hypothetical protein